MTNLTVIKEQNVLGKDFKIYGDFENPLFLAKDVSEWIEISNTSQMLNVVDEDEKALYTIYRVDGSTNKQWFLTEDGLYEILMQSRKPIAKQFKKEVKKILKDVRQNGIYAKDDVLDTMLNDPETAIRLLQNYKEKKEELARAEAEIKLLKPKAEYLDLILSSDSTLTTTEIADDYGLSAIAFNKLLNSLGIQYKSTRGQWLLYSNFKGKGYTKSATHTVHSAYGIKTKQRTLWTQKGREFLYHRLKEKGILPTIEQMQNEIA